MDDKNQFVSGVTVGPSCYVDAKKLARRKQRFTLLNAALDRLINNNSSEKTRKNKKSVIKSNDGKINGDKSNNAEAWKKIVGSMRPLHMQASRSSSSSPRKSPISGSGVSSPSYATSSKYASPSPLQDSENVSTRSPSLSSYVSQDNLLASTGNTSPRLFRISPDNLQEPESSDTKSPSISPKTLQKVEGASKNQSDDNVQESTGAFSPSALSKKLQEGSNTSTMGNSVLDDNLQECTGTMSRSVSRNSSGRLSRASSRRKQRASDNLSTLRKKGKMGSRKSTTGKLRHLSSRKMRGYKSALDLDDLDLNEEIEAEEEVDDKLLENCAADVMIDAKADQFIKQFYQQIQSQRKGNRRQKRSS